MPANMAPMGARKKIILPNFGGFARYRPAQSSRMPTAISVQFSFIFSPVVLKRGYQFGLGMSKKIVRYEKPGKFDAGPRQAQVSNSLCTQNAPFSLTFYRF